MLGNMYCAYLAATSALVSFLSVMGYPRVAGVRGLRFAREKAPARDRALASGRVKDDLAPRLAPVGPRVGPAGACVPDVADERVAAPEVRREVPVLDPDEALAAVARLLARELVGEAHHDAGQVRTAIAVRPDAGAPLVVAPQALSRLVEERVHVLGDGDVAARPADLEHASALAGERPVHGDPDGLDEEVLPQDHRDEPLVLTDAPARPPEVRVGVVPRSARGRDVEVVLEHQALRGGHRRFRLVAVPALPQGGQARAARD